MTPQTENNALARALDVVRRSWYVPVLLGLLAAAAAGVYSATRADEYTATASLLFRSAQVDQGLFGTSFAQPAQDPDRLAQTNLQLVTSDVVAARAARALGDGSTLEDVKAMVEIEPSGQSDIVKISARAPAPERAARVANLYAEQYIEFRIDAESSRILEARRLVDREIARLSARERDSRQGRTLRDRSEQLSVLASLQTGNAELTQPARPPSSRSSPRPVRSTVLGLMLGLLFGLGLVLLLDRIDRRFRDLQSLEAAVDAPVLADVPESRSLTRPVAGGLRMSSIESEVFLLLRTRLRYLSGDDDVRSVLITSYNTGDGKSTVALHLAAAASVDGSRVLLVEADMRQPTLAKRLGLSPAKGLSGLLTQRELTLDSAVQSVQIGEGTAARGAGGRVDCLTAGVAVPNPGPLLAGRRMSDILTTAKESYDLVVVDTPPMSAISDAIPLARQVDGTIVITRLGRTRREDVTRLRRQIDELGIVLLGYVINGVSMKDIFGYSGYSAYSAPPAAPEVTAPVAASNGRQEDTTREPAKVDEQPG